ncbi:MAG: hypothetical protein E7329_00165 [Clostridiales bacterium]|nr:hypothetical protein [Clostridiales bacterium]
MEIYFYWEGSPLKRRLIALLLLCSLVCVCWPAQAADREVLYNGMITRRYENSTTSVYKEMDKDGKVLKYMNPGSKIEIVAIYPDWVEIVYGSSTGFVLRNRIDVTETVDPANNPPYPVMEQHYYAVIDRQTEVKAEKGAESETLEILTPGAQVALEGVEDGWARLIYKRQYGYIDTRNLSEIYPVAGSVETADENTPISVFHSFFKDDPPRNNNLAVACAFISKVMQPGETMNFNDTVSPFSSANGYQLAGVLVDGELKKNYGGGSCQVSSTLWDSLMQLPGITVLLRKPHGDNAASYLPHGMDASSGTDNLNFIFRNDYDFPIRIDASTHDLCLFVAIYKETK